MNVGQLIIEIVDYNVRRAPRRVEFGELANRPGVLFARFDAGAPFQVPNLGIPERA